MKKYTKAIAFALSLAVFLCGTVSCKHGDDAAAEETAENNGSQNSSGGTGGSSSTAIKNMKIALYGADTSKTWNVWAWKENGSNDENYDSASWPGGSYRLTSTDSNGCIYLNMNIDTSYDLGILFVASSGSPQTADVTVPKSILTATSELYFMYGSTDYYTSFSQMGGISAAYIASADGKTLSATVVASGTPALTDVTVEGSDGTVFTVSDVSLSGTTMTIALSDGDISKAPYTVTYRGVSVTAAVTTDLIDEIYDVDSLPELGVSISGSTASFATWAPLASKVQLALYGDASAVSKTANATLKDMSLDSVSGVWSVSDVDISTYKYYQYAITNDDSTNYVADIWHGVASADSVASQIADIDDADAKPASWESAYTNPFTGSDYSNAVIYEMHIRDWSRAVVSDSTGKFLDIADSSEIISHLKDLGVTHVQILPMFDYAQKNSDSAYNWGYNPYHYNVPEGRYVTAGYTDGTQAVQEMRAMIKAFHDAGIAVIMDVVYNHTNGTGTGSLYDMTVPKYFYRLNSDGSYSDGSGCGNEIATNHAVVKKYVIESLKHWMQDYHINGFRFDLMGCLEADTMQEIYDELYKIDSKVMVYGEPWTGGTSAVVEGATAAGKGTDGLGYAAFDDAFRDAIKGAEFGGFKKGQVQGTFNDSSIIKGLTGAETRRNKTDIPALSLHYVECHDNYTLFDKLAISALGKTSYSGDLFTAAADYLSSIQAQDTLAAAYVFLSQGTPFINGGQEFLRTKKGNDNSYNASDSINQIDLGMKDTYSDVYNTYKGLIALRKANSDAFGGNTAATAETYNSTSGLTRYVTGDFCVYFNATDSAVDIDTTGYTTLVDVTSGTPAESTELPTSVAAKSFVILKN